MSATRNDYCADADHLDAEACSRNAGKCLNYAQSVLASKRCRMTRTCIRPERQLNQESCVMKKESSDKSGVNRLCEAVGIDPAQYVEFRRKRVNVEKPSQDTAA